MENKPLSSENSLNRESCDGEALTFILSDTVPLLTLSLSGDETLTDGFLVRGEESLDVLLAFCFKRRENNNSVKPILNDCAWEKQ